MVEEESGVRRWLVDITGWHPSPAEFDAAASLLPPHEHPPSPGPFNFIIMPCACRFFKEDDRKRALVSRLLQYSLAHKVLGIPFHQISIRRTDEGKPYLYNNQDGAFPNFNFSTSHQGDYVGIASEPLCLVGLDIVSVSKPQGETVAEFIHHFSSYLTDHEWSCIVRAGTGSPNEMLTEFYRYWCLKEAYVKAIGAGVGFGLHRLEFHHVGWTNISIRIDGEVSRRWAFWLLKLDEMHLASIAKGHPEPEDAVNSYKKTVSSLTIEEEQLHATLEIPEEGFVLWTVEQLTRLLQD
ncbi:hypothetical protein PR202_gb00615 [Eleusine coracana subsp. coracana]|uniref:holo-[acyl-carrier-protein] synthase n=1 Tax=Eleusine coracana subsp. coracana TaxID=191504 RepID=A0AAV5DUD2_ELECO|nr:hypothetical protein PR202_gb00615 [Eleusine coracana subsp. coracana]